ncbi:hypothetical protein TB2_007000 [Malus domestica]|uniref:Disease resistance N-terminal domain-containing protein n=1 Tax=Malus domestica TaxID=3750 RepID=A0A498IMF5_MALDO|nr:hypothetical protein DVH24_002423 [Malus domestica]
MGFLDDLDADPMTQDLDFIMKNFEKEIAVATTSCHSSPPLGKKDRSLRGMISRAVVSNARGAGTHNVFPSFLPKEVDKIKDPLACPVVDFIHGQKITRRLLKKLKIKLFSVNLVLDDAKEKQFENPAVREWLDKLKDVLYAADDLLDEINGGSHVKSFSEKARVE